MSKANRNRQQSARERIAAQQQAARRAETRRRALLAGGATLAVIIIVVVLVVIKANQHSGTSSATGDSAVTGTALPASVTSDVTTVPAATLDKVGGGTVTSYNQKPVTAISGPPLVSGGKPEMLYIGAEFCPYCAAMRWSMAVALSRFGTLSPLHGIHSSSTDTDPNTPTLTFYKSSYTSKYLTFTPVENETRTHALLQSPTKAQNAIWAKYEPNPETRGYPFIDFGNKYMIAGPLYDPATLAGMSWAQVASALHDPSSTVAQGALGAANYITAAICKMTNNQPSAVCTTSAVTSLESKL
jgi:thiol-disulfide isomerase/thioredoxin